MWTSGSFLECGGPEHGPVILAQAEANTSPVLPSWVQCDIPQPFLPLLPLGCWWWNFANLKKSPLLFMQLWFLNSVGFFNYVLSRDHSLSGRLSKSQDKVLPNKIMGSWKSLFYCLSNGWEILYSTLKFYFKKDLEWIRFNGLARMLQTVDCLTMFWMAECAEIATLKSSISEARRQNLHGHVLMPLCS